MWCDRYIQRLKTQEITAYTIILIYFHSRRIAMKQMGNKMNRQMQSSRYSGDAYEFKKHSDAGNVTMAKETRYVRSAKRSK